MAGLKGEDVHIIGAANSAGQATLHHATVANSVTMLARGDGLSASMSHYLAERILATPNIQICYQTAIEEVRGTDHLEAMVLRDTAPGERQVVPASALFVFIGAAPRTSWLDDAFARDDRGVILTGLDVRTKGCSEGLAAGARSLPA